ncbi:MAG TPA: ABC transporter permease [Tenuifilaceae bacterium]|nr:ABC transporter permease [Tenuifilaceae bacterium]
MIKNYLVTAYRNILRGKGYSLINVVGLAIGVISAILVLLFVTDELSYDKHYKDNDRVYRLISHFTIGNNDDLFAVTSASLAPVLQQEHPEIEDYARFVAVDNFYLNIEGKEFYEEDFYYADSSAFRIFSHKFLAGNPENALVKPYSVVLTESVAKKLFGNQNAIGQSMRGMMNEPFTVTGVIEDLPNNTHFKYKALVSVATVVERIGRERFRDYSPPTFWNVNVISYIKLKEGSNLSGIQMGFPDFYERHMSSIGEQINASFKLIIQPLADCHFSTIKNLQGDFPVGSKANIYIFSVIALFILSIACINYMNMATARAAKRAREVGIRKVVGSQRSKLVGQFLSESVLLSILATAVALFATWLILPGFNALAEKQLTFSNLLEPQLIGIIVGITILVGLVSGSYPAFYLSSFRPLLVLKGNSGSAKGHVGLRKALVVFQFAISITMIIATIIVSWQQHYIKTKDLGYKADNLVIVPGLDSAVSNHIDAFKLELLSNPAIESVAGSTSTMGLDNAKIVCRIEQDGEMKDIAINLLFCDHDYLNTLGLELAQGRNFDKTNAGDAKTAFLINETAAKVWGWTDNPLGKRVQFGWNLDGTVDRDGSVVGVVKDFHYTSIHNPVEPFLFILMDFPPRILNVRVKDNTRKEAVEFLEQSWHKFNATRLFNYNYLDQRLAELYSAEQKMGILFRLFSLLTIFISCLGLLGLSSFVTEQKNKEIGIRKVLGGASGSIVYLISKEFIGLVLLANLFAWPVAYWGMARWLQDFSYRIDFGLSPFYIQTLLSFVVASIVALIIAVITVGGLAWKATQANPVDAIKYE